jgi:protein-S-isoprenylcysteine O-methyltransferase Ste14
MLSIMIWFVGTLVLTAFSWRILADRRSSRFARFLAVVTLWALLVWSAPAWLHTVRLIPQILSWALLAASLLFGLSALYVLSAAGVLPLLRSRQSATPNSRTLVQSGPYKHIRHPIHLALLLLCWAAAFRVLSFFSVVLALIATALFCFCSYLEDLENLERFGEEYDRYMEKTGIFIPGVF